MYICKKKKMKTYIKEILVSSKGTDAKGCRRKMGVTQSNVSATISRPSFPTLERITTALNVEPWQLLAPPAVVEELKQAKAQRAGGGGGGLVGVVRVGCEIYTADRFGAGRWAHPRPVWHASRPEPCALALLQGGREHKV
nr:MAG TPA: repressor protein CI [Caudoviricetes sp.]